MKFYKHSGLNGKHAVLSPSTYHWVNYSESKFLDRLATMAATKEGTRIHAFAAEAISLRTPLADSDFYLNNYVNTAISEDMTPEQILFYSQNAFGTADAISFRDNTLTIHDLKTGVSKVSMTQLHIYAALFCLEYEVDPEDIEIVCRIFQNGLDVQEDYPEYSEIRRIMTKIVAFDKLIRDKVGEN